MADLTAIEWTDATWNPVTGCNEISAGCDHCYAERFSERFRGDCGIPLKPVLTDALARTARPAAPLAYAAHDFRELNE